MRFTLVKELRTDPLMRPLLNGVLIFIVAFLFVDIFLKYERTGIDVATISNTLYGNEEEFADPISEQFFLELLHAEIFFIMMTLLTLSAIYARLAPIKRRMLIVINVISLAAISEVVMFVLAYYVGSLFIYIWIVSFWTWHIGAIFVSTLSLFYLNFQRGG